MHKQKVWLSSYRFEIEFCYECPAWLALIKLLVDSVHEDNGNVCKSFTTLVNKLMITAFCYKSGKLMITVACYKSRVDARIATRVVSQWWRVW